MKAFSADTKLVRSASSLSCELDGETVLLNAQTGKYFKINAVGSSIWKMLEQQPTLSEIFQSLEIEYEVAQSLCETQTRHFLTELLSRKLISTPDEIQT